MLSLEDPVSLAALAPDGWHREMFDEAPIAMLEEDWRGAKRAVDALIRQGITDLERHVADHPDFIAEVRATHRVVNANAAALRLFGFPSKEEFLASARELLPANLDSNMKVYRAIATGATCAEGERVLRDKQGLRTPILWRTRIPSTEEAFSRMVFYAVDVSALKRAEEALVAAHAELARASRSAMLGEMVASIAHEINQPLGAIKLYADTARRWLDRPQPDLARARRSVESAYAEADRASQIVVRVKNLVRGVRPSLRRVSVSDVIAAAVALVERDARRHRVKIDLPQDAGRLAVLGEETQIQQALVNLLTNAMESVAAARQSEGRVQISARRGDDSEMVEIEVADNGPGLPPGLEAQVFRPFFTTKPEGMGLGLAITRTIIESQGGWITAGNRNGAGDGGGAVVSFALPHCVNP